MSDKKCIPAPFYALGLIALCLSPWLILQYNLRIPADAAFLFSGANMMLEGKSMSEYYFDNNPPMSFMIYIPAALLHSVMGLAKHDALQIYTLMIIGTSSIFCAALLARWQSLKFIDSLSILCAYTAVLCIFPYKEFGQKDHLLAIALLPFALAQLTIMHKADADKKLPALIMLCCTPFIFLKPHYLILPCTLIVYRACTTSLRDTIKAIDIWILTLTGVLYLILIQIITPDFITVILPNSLELYVETGIDFAQLKVGIAFLVFTAFLLFYSLINTDKTERDTLSIFSSLAACITIIPFIIQNKGFSLHLFPCIAFISVAILLNSLSFLEKQEYKAKNAITYIPVIILTCVLYSYLTFSNPIPRQNTYHTTSSLTALLKERASNGSYLFESSTTNIFHTHALYLENKIGSRFPNFWFLNNLNEKSQTIQKNTWMKFGTLLAKDLERHKPALIGLLSPETEDQGFLAFFGGHPDFQDEWGNYKYDGKFTLNAEEYGSSLFKDKPAVTYDIYIRKK